MPATVHPVSIRAQRGLTLVEILLSVTVAALLLAGITGVIRTALDTENVARKNHDQWQELRFAMQRMVDAVAKTRRLMIPLGENPATAWLESERNVLAVTLDPTLDRNKDGWADANNDKDFLDVNQNSLRDAGEPELIDEDVGTDNTYDGKPGIKGIDDNGDGIIDNSSSNDNDEDGSNLEDSQGDVDNDGNFDDDGDGAVDEDIDKDMNRDGKPGISGVDDDFDGTTDEGSSDDDDEDDLDGEDWFDPVVFFLNGTTLMQRIPNINSVNGQQYTHYVVAENVSQFLVKRLPGNDGASVLVDITLALTPPGGDPIVLNSRVGVGSAL